MLLPLKFSCRPICTIYNYDSFNLHLLITLLHLNTVSIQIHVYFGTGINNKGIVCLSLAKYAFTKTHDYYSAVIIVSILFVC